MSEQQPPADTPQPSTVMSEPATVEACQADYDSRTGLTNEHPSSWNATLHTLGRN